MHDLAVVATRPPAGRRTALAASAAAAATAATPAASAAPAALARRAGPAAPFRRRTVAAATRAAAVAPPSPDCSPPGAGRLSPIFGRSAGAAGRRPGVADPRRLEPGVLDRGLGEVVRGQAAIGAARARRGRARSSAACSPRRSCRVALVTVVVPRRSPSPRPPSTGRRPSRLAPVAAAARAAPAALARQAVGTERRAAGSAAPSGTAVGSPSPARSRARRRGLRSRIRCSAGLSVRQPAPRLGAGVIGWDSEAAAASDIVSSDIDSFSHDARASTALRGSAASGSSRAPPRSIHCPVRRTRRSVSSPPSASENLAGPDAHRLRRDLDLEEHPVLGSSEHLDPPECRSDVLFCLAALARPGDTQGRCCHRGGHEARHRERSGAIAIRSPSPRAPTRPRVTASCSAGARSASAATPATTIPSGSAAVSRSGRTSRSIGSAELDVEVLGVGLVPDREREPEADLRPGREPLGERERELHDPERPLEAAGDVAVPDEAHLAVLREPHPHREPGVALHDGTSRAPVHRASTGTVWPWLRSWPVPWLPPAGGTGDATTCSMRVVGAHPAVVARRPPAIGEPVLGQRGLPVLPEEVLVQPGRDVVPRQDLVLRCGAGSRTSPGRDPRRPSRRSSGRAGSARSTPGTCRRARHTRSMTATDAPVATRREPLGERRLRVVPLHLRLRALAGRRAAARSCAAAPRRRSGRTTGTACAASARTRRPTPCSSPASCACLPTLTTWRASSAIPSVSSSISVGQADEEVELHPPPALRERGVDRGVEVFLGDQLVDHLADPPRPAFGREREPGAAHLLDLARDADGERVDPQRRQRERRRCRSRSAR